MNPNSARHLSLGRGVCNGAPKNFADRRDGKSQFILLVLAARMRTCWK